MASAVRSVVARAGRLAIGTVVGQGLVFLTAPYLGRLYPPTRYGVVALLLTVSAVSSSAACLRYDLTIPAANPPEVQGLVRVCLGAAGTSTLLVMGGMLIARRVAPTPSVLELSQYFSIVSVCVFLVGAYRVTNALLPRAGRYNALMGTRISQGPFRSVIAALRGLGLLLGHLMSWISGLYALVVVTRREERGSESAASVARTYSRVPALSGADVWLPWRALVLPGVTIGDGATVGAFFDGGLVGARERAGGRRSSAGGQGCKRVPPSMRRLGDSQGCSPHA